MLWTPSTQHASVMDLVAVGAPTVSQLLTKTRELWALFVAVHESENGPSRHFAAAQ
jgi:hypothetical protein